MLKKTSFLLCFLLVLTACGEMKEKKKEGKFGMMDKNIPEYAALQFFRHIYMDKDINGALVVSSPKMTRLLQSYRTNKNVQRHVLNMRFDEVKIEPHAGSAGRNEFAKDAQVTLFFEGTLDDNILKDMRVVNLVRPKNKWLVDEVSLE
jgi:hypothetical protein